MVQWRAARWVKQEYRTTTSVCYSYWITLNGAYCLNISRIAHSSCFSSFYTKTHLLSEYHIICPPHWLIIHSTLTIYITCYYLHLQYISKRVSLPGQLLIGIMYQIIITYQKWHFGSCHPFLEIMITAEIQAGPN